MAVRYDPNLLDQIRRTVKNYQAKRQRVLAKGGDIIPDPASVSRFLTDYTDRRSLIRDLKRLQRYNKRGSEQIVTLESGQRLTRFELGELKRRVAQAKRNITLELKQAPDVQTLQPLTRGHYENLQARYQYLSRPISKLSKRQFVTFERIAYGESDIESKRRTFYENLHTMADDLLYGVPADIADRFRQALTRFDMNKIVDLMNKDPYVKAVVDYYEVLQGGGQVEDLSQKIEDLTDYLNAL